ncbi:MAG: polysaccharide biosynthesis/export family protein [Deltaproteobacteria bacterium]|nr:polysaccharide biosynthesis/export family protein [Deltaproteobacteria bacterium]
MSVRSAAVALLAAGLIVLSVASVRAETLSPGQTIIVRYYAGDNLVKTLTVTPAGDAIWTTHNLALAPKINRAEAVVSSPGGTEMGVGLSQVTTNEFRIGPGDVLDVNVWDNAHLSKVVPVRPDGMISLPLVGDVRAAGKTAQEMRDVLGTELRRFIDSPTVTVTVSAINSYTVFVQGAVTRPGSYPISGGSTITHAISLAGGFTEFADKGGVIILRTKPAGGTDKMKVNYARILSGKDPDVRVLPGDTIVVP